MLPLAGLGDSVHRTSPGPGNSKTGLQRTPIRVQGALPEITSISL